MNAMTAIAVFLIVIAIAALAPHFGVDTRDGRDWQPRRPRNAA